MTRVVTGLIEIKHKNIFYNIYGSIIIMKSTKLPRKVLLEYLDKYSLGYAATRKERIAIKMRFNNQQEVLKENINKFSKGGYNKNLKLNNVEDDTEILPYPFAL